MAVSNISSKKKALLAYKEKLLEDIRYCEKRIDEFLTNRRYISSLDSSSDSEDELITPIDTGPSVPDLKRQQVMLTTCLHATQELTNVTVLQSEVLNLTEDPKFEGEPPVKEPGSWREVTADCRVDLVPFTITFYVHTPERKFAAHSYRGLRVGMVKAPHEEELAQSVLHSLVRPSDAVEVLRSYAVAYRSRRSTLARLFGKYGAALHMEMHPEGGFVLKCVELLEVVWRLENKWSPVAPFLHKMKFDLEYMDEAYIKTISQTHKHLSDPSIQTDERTLLLAKIITTCLEARGPVDPQESMESDLDSRPDTRKDSEAMAPPKSLPKKARSAKGLPQKRSIADENNDNVKRMKTSSVNNERVLKAADNSDNVVKAGKETVRKSNKNNNIVYNSEDISKDDNRAKVTKTDSNTKTGRTENDSKENRDGIPNTTPVLVKTKKSNAVLKNDDSSINAKKTNATFKEVPDTKNKAKKHATKKTVDNNPSIPQTNNISEETGHNKKVKNIASTKTLPDTVDVDQNQKDKAKVANKKISKPDSKLIQDKITETPFNKNSLDNLKNTSKKLDVIDKPRTLTNKNTKSSDNVTAKADSAAKNSKVVKAKSLPDPIVHNKNQPNVTGNRADNKVSNIAKSKTIHTADSKENNENTENGAGRSTSKQINHKRSTMTISKTNNHDKNDKVNNAKVKNDKTIDKVTEKNVAAIKNRDRIIERVVDTHKLSKTKDTRLQSATTAPKTTIKSQNLLKTGKIMTAKLGNKIFKVGSTEKGDSAQKISKIPLKLLSPISKASLKKNPLRISPRFMNKPAPKPR